MFTINDDLSIYVTRGDIVHLNVSAESDGEPYIFKVGDVLRIKIFTKKDCSDIIFQKDFPVTTAGETAEIFLTGYETRIGGVINKHSDYWYEIELNPESNPQTIIGYDEDGAKIFRLFPDGRNLDVEEPDITPEDVAILDDELDVTSLRPVENQAIVRGIERTAQRVTNELNTTITAEVEALNNKIDENVNILDDKITENTAAIASNKSKIDILDDKITEDITSLQSYISSEHSDIRATITSATSAITNDLNVFKNLVNNGYHTEYLGRFNDVGTQIGEINKTLEQKISEAVCLYTGSVGRGATIHLENSSKYNVFWAVLDDSFKTSILLIRSGIGVYAENQMCVKGSLSTTFLQGCSLDHTASNVSINTYFVDITVYQHEDKTENWEVYSHLVGFNTSGEATRVSEIPILEIYGII